jgi:hypothetical protein
MIKRAIKVLRLEPNKQRLGSASSVPHSISKYQKASPRPGSHATQQSDNRREVAFQRIKSLKPLYYEGQPMAMEWAQKAIKDLEYTRKWFSCLGEGVVTVF